MRNRLLVLSIFAALVATGGAEAQSWQTPSFLEPTAGSDLGAYLVGGDGAEGIQGIWRSTGPMNLGLRLGFLDAGDGVIQGGAETWGAIDLEGMSLPLDLAWTAGAGVSVNGATTLSVPVGVTIGKTLEDTPLTVYGHPRVSAVLFNNPVTDELEFDLGSQFDIGGAYSLNQDLLARVSITIGDADAFGVGVSWRQ